MCEIMRIALTAPRRSVVAALAIAVAGTICCARARVSDPPGAATSAHLRAGNHEFTVMHAGRTRNFIVHMPPRTSGPMPVLVAFHGGGGNAAQFQRSSGIDAVSDREGFVVVYPNGTGALANRLLTFNAGDGCCGYARNNDVDDVGFAVAAVNDLAQRTPVDRRRVYATGHSNGGMMAHRVGAEASDFFAAIAAVSGSLDLAGSRFAPENPVPVLQIHSVDDPRALYEGGLGPPFPGTNSRVLHQSVKQALDRWIAANGCSTMADTLDRKVGAAATRNAGIAATKLAWRSCRGGAEVMHWKLSGSGHGWPGNAASGGGETLVGKQTNIIIAAEEVWSFVSRFSR